MRRQLLTDRPIRVGVFSSAEDARKAVAGLLDAGFTPDQISVVTSDHAKEALLPTVKHEQPAGTYTPLTALAGGILGAALGGLAIVGGALASGSMSLVAAGPAAAWFGGVAGGLVGAMMSRGVEREVANFYDQAVTEGKILVAAEDEGPHQAEMLAAAERVLADAGAAPLPLPVG
jgi:hypothetical protein